MKKKKARIGMEAANLAFLTIPLAFWIRQRRRYAVDVEGYLATP
jgi:hypothetical protein